MNTAEGEKEGGREGEREGGSEGEVKQGGVCVCGGVGWGVRQGELEIHRRGEEREREREREKGGR